MKIFFAHATDHTFKYDAYKAIQTSAFYKKYEVTLPQVDGYQPPMPRDIIIGHDLLIAECSYPSTGQGIELGWCHSVEIPILCIYKKGHTPSGALKNVANEVFAYTHFDEMLQKMEEFVKNYE